MAKYGSEKYRNYDMDEYYESMEELQEDYDDLELLDEYDIEEID